MAFPLGSFSIPLNFYAKLLVPLAPAFKRGDRVHVIAYDIDTKTYAIQGEDFWVHNGVSRGDLEFPPTSWERLTGEDLPGS